MKLIDLLNKIANGEASDLKTYFMFGDGKYNFYQFTNSYAIDINSLNWEVEIIEEDKKIEYIGKTYDLTPIYKDYPETAYLLKDLCDKTRELIDEVNKLKEK